MNSSHLLWTDLSKHLCSVLDEQEFNTWFSRASFTLKDGAAALLLPNYLFLNWIKDNYQTILEQALAAAAGKPLPLALAIAEGHTEEAHLFEPAATGPDGPAQDFWAKPLSGLLHPLYLFSNFLVGPSNKLAHAACLAVTAAPGRQYNPLFIYGETGLGKTHLLYAIGNAMRQKKPSARVLYCSAENFANDLDKALQSGSMAAFHEKYRQTECLLLDDLQFLRGEEQAQEEFFHTFNALHNSGAQIVLSGDKHPLDMIFFETKITSRFESGLLADIQPPDEELKISFINHKALEKGLELGLNVARFLARQPGISIRSLEGYLTKLMALGEIQNLEITTELAARIINANTNVQEINIDDIINIVAEYFAVSPEEMKSHKKSREISLPRQTAMYLARKLTKHSFVQIGKAFGNKDHSTVLKGVKKIEALLNTASREAEPAINLQHYIMEGKYVKK
jgi:chromosomal replication initiator protein